MKFLFTLILALIAAGVPAKTQPTTQCVTSVQAGGTANALTLPLLPCGVTTTVVVVSFSATNTSTAVTMQMTSAASLPVVREDGSLPMVGELAAGSSAIFTNTGQAWVKLTGNPLNSVPGAVGDGTTDDTAAVQTALNAVVRGGKLLLDSSKMYRVASVLTIPPLVTLNCGVNARGYVGVNPPASNVNLNLLGGVRLDSIATITLSGGSHLEDCAILRFGATFPTQDASAFAGTAINTIGVDSTDVWVERTLMVGFALCVDFNNGFNDRFHLLDVECDGTSGYKLGPSGDTVEMQRVGARPWATEQFVPAPVLTRTGTGFSFPGLNRFDDGKLSDLFDHGHSIGMDIENPSVSCCNIHFGGSVWLENNATVGLKIAGGAANVSFAKLTFFEGVTDGPSIILDDIPDNGRVMIGQLYVNGGGSDCVQLLSAGLDVGQVSMTGCAGKAFNVTDPHAGNRHLNVGKGFISTVNGSISPYIVVPAGKGGLVKIDAVADQVLFTPAALNFSTLNTTSNAPGSADACQAGQVLGANGFIYFCVASGNWQRGVLTGGY